MRHAHHRVHDPLVISQMVKINMGIPIHEYERYLSSFGELSKYNIFGGEVRHPLMILQVVQMIMGIPIHVHESWCPR